MQYCVHKEELMDISMIVIAALALAIILKARRGLEEVAAVVPPFVVDEVELVPLGDTTPPFVVVPQQVWEDYRNPSVVLNYWTTD
jgi:hypothetical protein